MSSLVENFIFCLSVVFKPKVALVQRIPQASFVTRKGQFALFARAGLIVGVLSGEDIHHLFFGDPHWPLSISLGSIVISLLVASPAAAEHKRMPGNGQVGWPRCLTAPDLERRPLSKTSRRTAASSAFTRSRRTRQKGEHYPRGHPGDRPFRTELPWVISIDHKPESVRGKCGRARGHAVCQPASFHPPFSNPQRGVNSRAFHATPKRLARRGPVRRRAG